ncbi:MAG: branched-chain amino acid aminotransferase [Candidatus Eremiobacteraeota bacterium]|nr:branched-chain amino acid aminotransferase [Candidatus Eremiobacteraeota bacterium]
MDLGSLVVYHRGAFKPYREATLGLLTHALQYGTGCFEGMRAFWNADKEQLYVFEPLPHFKRLRRSGNVLLMDLPHSDEELTEIALELCRRNGFREDAYIRPLLYKSEEFFGVRLDGVAHDLGIVAFPNSKYLETDDGLQLCVSSWRRVDDNALPARAKISGSYVNVALAKSEARLNGFDDAIVLTDDGHVSEMAAANVFVVRDGTVSTPDVSQNLLEGVTRSLVARCLREDCGLALESRAIDRTELYSADEIVVCGTGVGVAWVKSLDHRTIGTGEIGPVAAKLQAYYDDVTRARITPPGVDARPVYTASAVRGEQTVPNRDGAERALSRAVAV